jgi:3-oxoadipate enol-lactonase
MTAPLDLHRTVDGPEGAPVVVLLHAIGTSMAMWDPQLAALAAGHRVVRVDLRGHGASPVPPGPYSLADLGADVVGVLDRIGVDRVSVCGLSLGGMVGLWLAAHVPERIDRLVAACAVARPPSPQAWLDRARAVRDGGTAAVSDLVVERWGYADRAPEIRQLIVAMLAATPAEGYAGCCDAIAAMDLEPDLPRIAASTLLLAGRDDPAAPPSDVEVVAAAIPGARLEVIEGSAHLANVERADEMTTAILQHLSEVSP